MNIFDLIIRGEKPDITLAQIHFSLENSSKLEQLIKEHQYIEHLHEYKLHIDNKLLLFGHSGCGKTTTAKAIAHALKKNLIILNLGSFVSSRLGETSSNLKAVFDKAIREKAVLFLDEFDQVGTMRKAQDKDAASGEMRRLVNTLIQLIDQFPTDNLLIGATNYPELLDLAITRRFQLKLKFEMPSNDELNKYYTQQLSRFPQQYQSIIRKYNISFAEAKDLINTEMKKQIIFDLEQNMEHLINKDLV